VSNNRQRVQIAKLQASAAGRLVNRPAPGQTESMSTESEPFREPGYVARRVSKGALAYASGLQGTPRLRVGLRFSDGLLVES
jgi:hypothetical protein